MTMSLEEALRRALEDEYHARATYRAVLDAFGDVRPFVNIVESEERHIQALKRLLEKPGLAVPQENWAGRVLRPNHWSEHAKTRSKPSSRTPRFTKS